MAIKVTCEICSKEIHTDPAERKFRIDFIAPKEARGFDVCEECWIELRSNIKVL